MFDATAMPPAQPHCLFFSFPGSFPHLLFPHVCCWQRRLTRADPSHLQGLVHLGKDQALRIHPECLCCSRQAEPICAGEFLRAERTKDTCPSPTHHSCSMWHTSSLAPGTEIATYQDNPKPTSGSGFCCAGVRDKAESSVPFTLQMLPLPKQTEGGIERRKTRPVPPP